MLDQKNNFNSGLTLVEVLIAASIILVFLLALFGAHNLYLKAALSNGEVIKASALAEESLEIMRFFRDTSWDTNIVTLALDTDYFLTFANGVWGVNTTNIFVDSLFERKISLSAVYRDVNGDIITSGGTLDPDTVLVEASVSWLDREATTTKSISTYLTNLHDN
jgi:Tfp pilus assembly protein PilV